jgi:hypothetical protein
MTFRRALGKARGNAGPAPILADLAQGDAAAGFVAQGRPRPRQAAGALANLPWRR